MLTHIVLISVLEDTAETDIDAMIGALRTLPDAISEISSYEVGRDLGLRDGNASVAILAEFESSEDLVGYLEHPEHKHVVAEFIAPHASSVIRAQIP